MNSLKGKDFLKLLDFTSEEIEYLIELAAELRQRKRRVYLINCTRVKT